MHVTEKLSEWAQPYVCPDMPSVLVHKGLLGIFTLIEGDFTTGLCKMYRILQGLITEL